MAGAAQEEAERGEKEKTGGEILTYTGRGGGIGSSWEEGRPERTGGDRASHMRPDQRLGNNGEVILFPGSPPLSSHTPELPSHNSRHAVYLHSFAFDSVHNRTSSLDACHPPLRPVLPSPHPLRLLAIPDRAAGLVSTCRPGSAQTRSSFAPSLAKVAQSGDNVRFLVQSLIDPPRDLHAGIRQPPAPSTQHARHRTYHS